MKRLLPWTILALAVMTGWANTPLAKGQSCPCEQQVVHQGLKSHSGISTLRSGVARIGHGPIEPAFSPWNGANYYHTAWGTPVALVVPPTAELQTQWGWGVGGTRVTRIWPQFSRNYPGPGLYDPRQFTPTPRWPNHTDQFGAYYVRGPW